MQVERLKEIALNKRTHENSSQYIDQLIKSEEMQKNEGYLERIQYLNEVKNYIQLIYNKKINYKLSIIDFYNKIIICIGNYN